MALATHEMTFGIEIECHLPLAVSRDQVKARLPRGWSIHGDGSIRGYDYRTRHAMEVVSPTAPTLLLRGSRGMEQVRRVVATLRELGAQVNFSCGLHVHIGFDKQWRPGTLNYRVMQHMVGIVAELQKGIYASTGTLSRETGTYSRPLPHGENIAANLAAAPANRYCVINLSTFKSNPTVEFRAFAGTLNINKMTAHILTALRVVEEAVKRAEAGLVAVAKVKALRPTKATETLASFVDFCNAKLDDMGLTKTDRARALKAIRVMAKQYEEREIAALGVPHDPNNHGANGDN